MLSIAKHHAFARRVGQPLVDVLVLARDKPTMRYKLQLTQWMRSSPASDTEGAWRDVRTGFRDHSDPGSRVPDQGSANGGSRIPDQGSKGEVRGGRPPPPGGVRIFWVRVRTL